MYVEKLVFIVWRNAKRLKYKLAKWSALTKLPSDNR